ncbi:MAG: MFS transporter [Deltaproteobacteria bacterium]|nr:MFS transporter [Deltaproteobacteria bacterium]
MNHREGKTHSLNLNHIFYGWYVLAASFIILFFSGGAIYSVGIMFKPIISELGWSRGTFSIAFFCNMAVYACSLIAAGRLYDRYGPKWLVIVSTILFSGGFVGIFFINSFWEYLLLYGVISAAGMGGTTVPLFAAILSKWFEKHRGLAISLAISGSGIGQFVIVPLVTRLVVLQGWRISFLVLGAVVFITNICLASFVLKGDPDDLGYMPLGKEGDTSGGTFAAVDTPMGSEEDMSLSEAMKTRSFWLFTLIMLVCGSGDFFVSMHLVPFLTDNGMSAMSAGQLFAWFGLMSLLGVIIAGPATDLMGAKVPIAVTFFMRAVLFLTILYYKNITSFYVFSIGFGFTLLITAPIAPMLAGRLFGYSNVGLISGFITTVHHLGGGAWAYLGGVCFDKTGSYDSIFFVSMVFAVVAIMSDIFIREERHSRQSIRSLHTDAG